MVDVYSLNPQVLPSTPIPREEHKKIVTGGVIAAVVVIIIGLAYWWWASSTRPVPASDRQAELRAQIADILRAAKPVSQADINSVATQLSKAKPASEADKQSVAAQLGQAPKF